MAGVKVEQLKVPPLYLGEGPHWQENLKALLYVDVFGKAICRYFVETGRHQVLNIDDCGKAKIVTFVVPVEGWKDRYVVSVGNSLCLVEWKTTDPNKHTVKPTVIQVTEDSQFNDGKCDPEGRLWAGTSDPLNEAGELIKINMASLYRLDKNLSMNKCVDKVSISNGLTWSPDKKCFYYIDSAASSVDVFDYDNKTGAISKRRVLVDYKKAKLEGDMPDGMTCDVNGNLWVANFRGSKIICIDPKKGQVIRQVAMPTKNVSSLCWGGKDYATLFVTSGKFLLTKEEAKNMPAAGVTFAVTGLGTKGLPPNSFRPDLSLLKAKIVVGAFNISIFGH